MFSEMVRNFYTFADNKFIDFSISVVNACSDISTK